MPSTRFRRLPSLDIANSAIRGNSKFRIEADTVNLTSIDWAIMLVYFIFVLGIGFLLKRKVKTSTDFFLAGRAIPAWVCGLAFIATSHFYWVGAIPAMVFVGIFMMPFYYGSRARSVPEYLRLRFDEKTRGLNAI